MIATKYTQNLPSLGIQMQRPICVCPKIPHHKGSGNTNDAGSFECVPDFSPNNPMASPEYLH